MGTIRKRKNLMWTEVAKNDGFGVPQIYQQVPMEDEADEVFRGDKTDDGFEGEETCEHGLDADGEHNE